MLAQIRELAQLLNINDGGLLKLAKDVSHDGSLVAVEFLGRKDQEELYGFLISAARDARLLTASAA